ncbi:MAG: multicopper oxidase domain-containing protein [Gammaproteobacteria bacterium]
MLFDINEKFAAKLSWSKTSSTTSSGSMTGGGGGGGGMCGGVAQACYVYPDAPATPGIVTPDVTFNRGIYMNGSITMDDGKVITMWGFTDTGSNGTQVNMGGNMGGGDLYPSPAMRLTQGQIAHTTLTVSGNMWVHTIHHHGIEPADHADGVGHITWDVDGTYTYQWRPHQAGTYFYHCHTNTPLHTEMGMFGAIIVDPPEGPGTLFHNGPTYDAECFWVVDEIDSSWHTKCWSAGTCGDDAGLNILQPDYFVITGVDASGTSAKNNPPISGSIKAGQTLLARYISAGHQPQFIHLPAELNATVVMSDGRPLPNPVGTTGFRAIAGERYDIIMKPTVTGDYEVRIDIKDWITGNVWGTAKTNVVVS